MKTKEARLDPKQLRALEIIAPYFIVEGKKIRREVASMPGVFQFSIDEALKDVEGLEQSGVQSVLLFGVPSGKDAQGSGAADPRGVVPSAVREIKKRFPRLMVTTDICLCAYTDHGHCGLVRQNGKNFSIDHAATVKQLEKMAVIHAEAGADLVAPSDMMDGRVRGIRAALDGDGFDGLPVLSYAVKFASSFYGPFRDAAQSAPQFGDRRSYQMEVSNLDWALREAAIDVEEGADILMVKPALTSLDIIAELKRRHGLPVAAYNVSGEYSMVKAAAAKGWLDEKKAVLEMMASLRRAGADVIVTYWAKQIKEWMKP